MIVGEGWVKVAAPIVAGGWEVIFSMEKIERAAAKRLWQKWWTGKHHTDWSDPLLAIVVGMKRVDVVAPDLQGSWDLTVGEEGVTFLLEKIVSCC